MACSESANLPSSPDSDGVTPGIACALSSRLRAAAEGLLRDIRLAVYTRQVIPSFWVASFVLAAPTVFAAPQPSGPGPGTSLVAAAAASGRPRECASTLRRGLSRKPTVWELARTPEL